MRICGLDEAGRGPLAGPIVAAAVVITTDLEIEVMDSKKLTTRRREQLAEELKAQVEYHIEIIHADQINQIGMGRANCLIFERLIQQIEADYFIVDGNLKLKNLGDKAAITECIIRADQTEPVVSAASILAKTYRDTIMLDLHEKFPVYGWNQNKGYGTKQHISAIKTFGSTPYHRGMYVKTAVSKPYAEPLLLLEAGYEG